MRAQPIRYRRDPAAEVYNEFIARVAATDTVAYLDETFRKDGSHGETGFYSIVAVLAESVRLCARGAVYKWSANRLG